MTRRKITRIALLQNYTEDSTSLLPELDEVAAKGYQAVAFFIKMTEMDAFRLLCEKAASLGLGASVFTGYMKYQYEYLAEHPEQRMVSVTGGVDQDGIADHSWGCPFNPDFKERYFEFLRALAQAPSVFRIAVNDEAYLGDGCYCDVCQAAWRDQMDGEMPKIESPQPQDWEDEGWRRYLSWKMNRWDLVHGEMAAVVHAVKPTVEVIFQASPAVDLWRNPWTTGVNLAGMVEHLDGLSTDPYYTFHSVPHFQPREVYLSEWSRFLAGIVPEGKIAEIVPQGFSHPTFTRPLGEHDGYWSALVPLACGVDTTTPYTYTLQRCSPVQKAYEDCFRTDEYFAEAVPLKYAAVVHGAQTEVYLRPMPRQMPGSYDGTRVLSVCDALRHSGLPYGYLPDARVSDSKSLGDFPVVILPEVNCLSDDQARGITEFAESGGNLALLGQLGIADEIGTRHGRSLLHDITRIAVVAETGEERQFRLLAGHPIADALGALDADIPEHLRDSTYAPISVLAHCVDAEVPADGEIVAEFITADGEPTGRPAIVSVGGKGRILWFAGFPTRTTVTPRIGVTVRNRAHTLFASLVEWTAGSRPALRVENWPPDVPLKQLRPLDHRYMPTFEFFALAGDDLYMGVVTSYFREPTSFPMVLDVPPGRELQSVEEAISGTKVAFELTDERAQVEVAMDFDTPALVYLFRLQ